MAVLSFPAFFGVGGAHFWVFLEFWGPKWAQKYPILLGELLEMAITTFPAILSQIRDGSIFVKNCKAIHENRPVTDFAQNRREGSSCHF